MPRPGMSHLILNLREKTHTSASDYTLNGVSYWTDDQLEAVLDQHRTDVVLGRLTRLSDTLYAVPARHIESGDAFEVQAPDGSVVSGYTLDPVASLVTFTAPVASDLTASYRAYDLDNAAADVWEIIAAHASDRFDVSTPDHKLMLSQLRKNALAMAQHYRDRDHSTLRSMRLL